MLLNFIEKFNGEVKKEQEKIIYWQNLTNFINNDKISKKLNIFTEVCLGFRLN